MDRQLVLGEFCNYIERLCAELIFILGNKDENRKKTRGLISSDKITFYFYFMMAAIEILKRHLKMDYIENCINNHMLWILQ